MVNFYYFDTKCSHCGRSNERHIGRDCAPQDGDFAICWSCRGVNIFVIEDEVITERVPTAEEMDEISSMPLYRRAREAYLECYTAEQAMELLYAE